MIPSRYNVMRDPVTGEPLSVQICEKGEGAIFGPTGVLKGSSRDYPVLGGVVITREDLATVKVTNYARNGQTEKALFEALRIEKRSKSAAFNLLTRLKYPRLLQCHGSPCGVLTGPYGIYFRYRYSVANLPSTIGLLSCLRRSAAKDGYLLDVGSGFGHFYRYYLHSYPAEKVILMDNTLEFLITASRFVDPRTLLVCADADTNLPFQKKAFTDITVLNAFQVFKNKERFVEGAKEALDASTGTLWLTNNWNPRLTDQFSGPARPPSQWSDICNSDHWRMFPERHFADPVMRGGLINLAVKYVPQDDHPAWRSVTFAYSNAAWDANSKCVPLNRAPKWQHLATNSVYYRSPFRNRLIKRKIAIKFWDSHKEYYGFDLPDEVILPGRMDRRTGRGLQSLAESLVMVESLCPVASSPAFAFLSSLCSWLKDCLGSLFSSSRITDLIRSVIPRSIKLSLRKLLAAR